MRDLSSISVYRSLEELPAGFGPSVAAIGNFDGVHLGHRELLAAVVSEARATGARALAVTFDPHPERLLNPEQAPELLTPVEERVRLLAGTGIDAVLVLSFDAKLAAESAHGFVERVLAGRLGVRSLHEGANFRFGRRAEAGIEDLKALGAEFGFAVHVHEAVRSHGLEISSSAIRAAVAAGRMREARWMLGRPFSIVARQERGRGVGSRLLVPTVNLADYAGLVPAFGVYVTRMRIGERRFQAVTNVGDRPTFAGIGFSIETHILDFEPVEMGPETPVEVEFLLRLRGEAKWPTLDALKAQILKDVARAQRYFRLAPR